MQCCVRVSHAVVEKAAGRGPLGLTEGRGGMMETVGLEWVFPSTGEPGMAGTFFSVLSENQRDWAGDWQITYYLLNHERFCLVMERFLLKPNKARRIRGSRTSLISFVLIKSPCNHFLTRFILHLHPKHSQKHQGKWCKHKWSYCVSCIDMQSLHWYAIHV